MKRIMLTIFCWTIGCAAAMAESGKTTDCYCTDRGGNRVELGQMMCLSVDGRSFMAQCQMSLNVPMWREVQDGCLSSDLDPAQQSTQISSPS